MKAGPQGHIQERRVVGLFILKRECIERNDFAQSKFGPHFGRL